MPDTMGSVTTPRGAWSIAGAVAGVAGLAVGHAMTMALTLRSSPLVAFAEAVLRHVPEVADDRMGTLIGPESRGPLVVILVLVALLFSMWAGRLAERSWWQPILIWVGINAVCLVEVVLSPERTALAFVPVTAGAVTSIVLLSFVSEPLHRIDDEVDTPADGKSRRSFIIRTGLLGALVVGVGIYGESFGRTRRHVEQTRRLLNLPITDRPTPVGASFQLEGVAPWRTPIQDFFIEHTAVATPTVEPLEWSLRIHGMVDHEVVLSYQDLLDRPIREQWTTLSCAKDPVGGDKIGNAWWSGIRISKLLKEAGVSGEADAVLQTSHDGWTCGTPLAAMLDPGRNALLAIGMNGEPLTLDHGFPVRTIVPGLFGHVSACKWVVDLEVTRFADFEAFPTKAGWSEAGPVVIGSRIDLPEAGTNFEAGVVSFAGYAWSQHIGISAVEIALDGDAWQAAELATVPNQDTWVQWRADIDLPVGDHSVRVRAIGSDGTVQTGVQRDPKPDGATGWHEIEVSAQ